MLSESVFTVRNLGSQITGKMFMMDIFYQQNIELSSIEAVELSEYSF